MQHSTAVPIDLPLAEKHAFVFHIARLNCDRGALQSQFGPPQFRDFVDGIGDAEYWAFLYPCGMKLLYEFTHGLGLAPASNGFANVYGDLPEFEHARRHIPFSLDLSLSSGEANAAEIAAFRKIEPWATVISSLNAFQVWRQGDDGNEMPVGLPTSQRDAQCWVNELESHGHKQMYWYSSLHPIRSEP
jgi:hypothetical protein